MSSTTSFDDLTTKFLAWLRRNGVWISPKIRLADLRHLDAGRGVVAEEDIDIEQDLFIVPRSAILLPDTTSMPASYIESLDDPWLKLILAMIWELQQGTESKWQTYLNVLPDSFNTLMYWTEDELHTLKGSAALNKIGKTSAEAAFAEKIYPIMTAHKTEFHAEQLSQQQMLQLFHRMGSTIMAYAFDLESSDSNDNSSGSDDSWQEDYEEDAPVPVGMIPLADMLNASGDKNNAKLYYEADKVVMRSIKRIQKGQEIFNDYGALPRADLLRRYGYVTDDYTKYDVVEFDRAFVAQVAAKWRDSTVENMLSRLDYLEELGMATDAFEIVHQEQDERQVSAELLTVANTVILSDGDFAQLKSKNARPEKGALPLNTFAVKFMVQLITDRLAEYDKTGLPSKASFVTAKRLEMASKVVSGERHILNTAYMRVQNLKTSEDTPSEHTTTDERPHKRMRT